MEKSPRKAIQDWLSRTDWTCSKDSVGPSRDATPCRPDLHHEDGSWDLASELDLLPPFRHMDKRKLHSERTSPHRSKRKRDVSSPLPPESLASHSLVGDVAGARGCIKGVDSGSTMKGSQAYADSPPHTSSSSSIPLDEPPAKSYKRRPRHRTKANRYDLKDVGKTKARAKEPSSRQRKKQKRREKTGGALLHSFSATNVAQERLTVGHIAHTVVLDSLA